MLPNLPRTAVPALPVMVGKVYHVRHKYFGGFTARAEETNRGWSGFVIIDGNAKLVSAGFPDGSYLECTNQFLKVIAL